MQAVLLMDDCWCFTDINTLLWTDLQTAPAPNTVIIDKVSALSGFRFSKCKARTLDRFFTEIKPVCYF